MSLTPPPPEWHIPLPKFPPSSLSTLISPTSAPCSTAKHAFERKPKLRASCDACATSKVKCSKEHPICSRCTTNNSPCIYGISRKHGKPGRTRKRNPDGTPFVKASKQRPSPDGGEFNRFRVRKEADLNDLSSETASTPSWSETPDWPATPETGTMMTPVLEPVDMDADLALMDELLLASAQSPVVDHISTSEPFPELKDPFAQKEYQQFDFPMPPDFQFLDNFLGRDCAGQMEYSFESIEPSIETYADSISPESPRGSSDFSGSDVGVAPAIPSPSHCCYTAAYTVLKSLSFPAPTSDPSSPCAPLTSLDAVLSITKSAVQNLLQLLSCPCSADPHLAILYSHIISKLISWYHIAAGVKPLMSPSINIPTPTSSPIDLSPLSLTSPTASTFAVQPLPVMFGMYEFDEADQEKLRRHLLKSELMKCDRLVNALETWGGDGEAEETEAMYVVLGKWLKADLSKTLQSFAGGDA